MLETRLQLKRQTMKYFPSTCSRTADLKEGLNLVQRTHVKVQGLIRCIIIYNRLSRVINQSIEIQREFKNVSQTIRDMQVSVYNFWQRITPVESIIFLYSRKTQQSISQYILSQQDVQGIVKHISVEHAALVSFAVVPK